MVAELLWGLDSVGLEPCCQESSSPKLHTQAVLLVSSSWI